LRRKQVDQVLLTALALASLFSSLSMPTRADTQSTRISSANASQSAVNLFSISGILENRTNTEPVTWTPLKISERIELSWYTAENPATKRSIGEVWTSPTTGAFQRYWQYELEPGSSYRICMDFAGDTTSTTTFRACNATAALYVPLVLSVTLDSPTMSILQDDTASTGVTATVENSKVLHTISLSTPKWPSNLFGSATFTATQGTASLGNPFKSSMKITVKNQTQPGTYYVTVSASAAIGVTSETTLTVHVRQNVYTIYVTIRGLPPNIATKIYADKAQIAEIRGERTVNLVVSNKTVTISILREPPSGNPLTLYLCEDSVRNAMESGARVTEFTFEYVTKYAARFTANVAPDLTLTLKLQVGTVEIKKAFKPAQGHTTEFYPQGTRLAFTILPSYIPTENDVNYRFNTWKSDKGETLEPNAEGSCEIVLDRPHDLRAYFDKYVLVKATTDPSDVPVLKLQIGLKGSEKKVVDIGGPVTLSVGEYPADSVLEFSLDQNQFILTNSKADIRYVLDGFSAPNEILLKRHLTITIRYKVYYKLRVLSEFPEAVIQPRGGESWYLKGGLATIQVTEEAWGFEIFSGIRPIRYVFDRWVGAIESNRTQPYPFVVLQPMEIRAVWRLDLRYLGMITAIFSAMVATSALGFKKFLIPKAREKLQERRVAKKITRLGLTALREQDVRVFNCINGKKGTQKWSEIVNELGMSRERIEESVRRLKDAKLLIVNQRSCLTTADTVVRNYLKRNKGALKWSEAIKELGMSREQIEESVKRLRDTGLSEATELS